MLLNRYFNIKSLSFYRNFSKIYDVAIIGGGSGGIAAARECTKYTQNILVVDTPPIAPYISGKLSSILANKLGGTCVNVGCVPKKLMHTAGNIKGIIETESKDFGHDYDKINFNWNKLVSNISSHLSSINFSYKSQLKREKIEYINGAASFMDNNTIQVTPNFKSKESVQINAKNFIIATGCRPKPLNIPGDNYSITSNDLFSLKHAPNKTLIVGASYIALECAGFLAMLGYDVSVMVRSLVMRQFDQEMANLITDSLQKAGVKFLFKNKPLSISKSNKNDKLIVKYGSEEKQSEEEFDTVLSAIGREPQIEHLELEKIGVKIDKQTNKIIVNENDETNIPNIYAVGDVSHHLDFPDGIPELTPVASTAARLLVRRLFGAEAFKLDYNLIPTAMFAPIEYSCIGFSEEKAISTYGKENIEVYHTFFTPLEKTLAENPQEGYIKLITLKPEQEKVIGLHIFAPNASEVLSGYVPALHIGLKYKDIKRTVGIHPTIGEEIVRLNITKSSGKSPKKTAC